MRGLKIKKNFFSHFLLGVVVSALYSHLMPAFAVERLTILGEVNLDGVTTSGNETTWFERGNLGLRYDSGTELSLASLGLASRYILNNNYLIHVESLFHSGESSTYDLTQSYLLYRPLRKSRWKSQVKVGVFYAPWSLENTDLFWFSPYSTNFSAINSWLAEEVRTIGFEWRRKLPFKKHHGSWSWEGYISIFGFNDTAGTLLSWRGWSNHDRQTGIDRSLPLIDLPSFEENGEFSEQARETKPFVELDKRPGYYVGGEAKNRNGMKIRYSYYDNRANPDVLKSGLYAWHTRFHIVGFEFALTPGLKLLNQLLYGSTEMGRDTAWVYNDYKAFYSMLTYRKSDHRFSLRFEQFEVVDKDSTFQDTNDEEGSAWVFSHSYKLNKRFSIQSNFTLWKSERAGRAYFNDTLTDIDERQWLVRLKYRW